MSDWLTNLKTLEPAARNHGAAGCLVVPKSLSGMSLARWIHRVSAQCRAIVLYQPQREVLWLCAMRVAMFWQKHPPLFLVDNIFTVPGRSYRDRIQSRIKSLLYSTVEAFLLPQKDVSGIRAHYGLKVDQFEFVQFKVNGVERRVQTPERNSEVYVMAGGKSRRDYETFCKAMSTLDLTAKVVLPRPEEAARHETALDESLVPENVSIVRHDENPDTWAAIVAGAFIVAIPIDPDSVSASGVSLYMLAMAYGRPVVITEGCATRGVLQNKVNAMVVPPKNPEALAQAISQLCNDTALYARIAHAGKEYAHSMGGESEYMSRIAAAVARRTSEV